MERPAYIDDRAVTRRAGGGPGFLLVLLGIWVGLVPFAGPYINYQMQTTDTWQMTTDHFWLSVVPAAALFVGGWILARSFSRGAAGFGALIAFCAGIWLVIGPTFATLWNGGTVGGGPAFGSTGVRVAEWLGFYYAAGALAIMLSSYAMGYLSALPFVARRAVAPAPATRTAPAPPTVVRTRDGNGDGVPDEAQPRQKRFMRNPLTRAGTKG